MVYTYYGDRGRISSRGSSESTSTFHDDAADDGIWVRMNARDAVDGGDGSGRRMRGVRPSTSSAYENETEWETMTRDRKSTRLNSSHP